jgi:hypothetical protein
MNLDATLVEEISRETFLNAPSAPHADAALQNRRSLLSGRAGRWLGLVRVIVWFAAFGSLPLAHGAERLAIVSDAASEPLAALLTAELSKVGDVELVERAELDKVVREQALASKDVLASPLRLATGLHAAGVLAVESAPGAGQAATRARLIAVTPGVIVGDGVFAGEPMVVAEAIAMRFRPLFPKLAVERGHAVPLSLLNLRSAQRGDEALERQLTFLLAHRLVAQREFFVLERWRMDDLAWEKALGAEAGAFWNGSYLVDGTLDTGHPQRLTLRLFLRSPQAGAVRTFELSGDRDDLAGLAARAATELATALSSRPALAPWQPLDEAGHYTREAEWAERAGLWRVARDTAESAWALGSREAKLLALRTRSESALAFPPVQAWDSPWSHYKSAPIERASVGERLRSAAQALALFHEWRAGVSPPAPTAETAALGTTILLSGSRMLRFCWDHQLCAGEHREVVRDLRRKLRVVARVLFALEVADEAGDKEKFYEMAADYLPFWHETPADAVAAWRDLLGRRFTGTNRMQLYADVRTHLLKRRCRPGTPPEDCHELPWLVGWRGESAAELARLWQQFVASLVASPKLTETLDGALLQFAEENPQQLPEAGPAETRLREQLWAAREGLIRESLAYSYLWALHAGRDMGRPPSARGYLQRWLLHYLDHAERDEMLLLLHLWSPESFAPNEAADLYRRWLAYKQRVVKPTSYPELEARLLRKFPELAGPPAGSSAADTLTVKQFWFPPELHEPGLAGVWAPVWTDGRLWLSVDYLQERGIPGRGPIFGSRLYALELPSFRVVERIEAPHGVSIRNPLGRLLVRGDALYLGAGESFYRCDRRTRAWITLPLPARTYRSAFANAEGLVAGYSGADEESESGIVRWTAATGETTVLASSRRRPALHHFDDCVGYRVGEVFAGPGETVTAVIDQRGFVYDPRARSWSPFLADGAGLFAERAGDATLLISEACGLGLLAGERRAIEPWFGSRFALPGEPLATPRAPAELRLHNSIYASQRIAFAAGKMWMLRMRKERAGAGQTLVLSVFDRERLLGERPLRFEPAVEADAVRKKHARAPRIVGPDSPSFVKMLGTEAGLIFWQASEPGVWFLPLEDAAPAARASR